MLSKALFAKKTIVARKTEVSGKTTISHLASDANDDGIILIVMLNCLPVYVIMKIITFELLRRRYGRISEQRVIEHIPEMFIRY